MRSPAVVNQILQLAFSHRSPSLSIPDTPFNQQAYPQPSTQAPGCGFPIAKIGVEFSGGLVVSDRA
jgi:hypothetical protein